MAEEIVSMSILEALPGKEDDLLSMLRELYGLMLLESGRSAEALAAFEATLQKEPNRLGAYVGAAVSAEKAGDKHKAREYYEKIVAIAEGADDTRTEVANAREYLKKL